MGTNLDHLYNPAAPAPTPPTDLGPLTNRVSALETNAAKKNEENTFTRNQSVNGQIKCNTFLMDNSGKKFQMDVIDYQNKKYARLMFIDGSTERFMIEFNYNDNEASFKRGNVKVSAPTIGDHIANKTYVDNLKTEIKNIVSQSTNFDDFKRRMGQ